MALQLTIQVAQRISVRSAEDSRKPSARYDTMSICCDAKQNSAHPRVLFVGLRRWNVMLRAAPAAPFLHSVFKVSPMLAMSRILRLTDDPAASIPVRVFMPVENDLDWSCAFSIGWPDRTLERKVVGIDAIQSLELALRMIGTELYASEYHKTGRLMWLKPGVGYGFPVPNIIRDELIGEDRDYL